MSIKERLIKFLEIKKISKSEFGRRIGVSSAFITSMRKSMQPDKLQRIASEFPELNTSWLLTGEGEMLKSAEPATPSTDNPTIEVPADAWAIIRQQAASLEKKDREIEKRDERIDRLLALLEEKSTPQHPKGQDNLPHMANPNRQ